MSDASQGGCADPARGPGRATPTGGFTADATGAGRTSAVDLPTGQYKLTRLTDQARGAGKFEGVQGRLPDLRADDAGGRPAGRRWRHRPR
ncbi:hypothetical protein ACF08O_34255 [Streptomyces paradoxus]|uniref:hypothetical protein n=1 Tax=Streptomyces paradoxus TaxID=66375 RepID=UPI0036F510C1